MQGVFRKVVFLILLLGISFIAYQYMIKPANKRLTEQQAAVEKKLGKLSELKKATMVAEDMSKQLKYLEEAISFFESKLPPKSDIHKALEQITVIAQKQGLRPKTIRALKKKNNNGYIEQPLKMELEGEFNSFYSFLLEIEKLPRIMKIRELEISKSKTDDGKVSAKFIVSIFFRNKTG